MLDGGCVMRAGWVHQLKLYPFSIREGERFIVMLVTPAPLSLVV